MQHILASLNPVAISAIIVAIVLAATRLAPFTKPYWAWMPKALQAWLPSIVAGLPIALNAFGAVKTWLDFAQAVLVVGAVPLALAVPGMSSPHNHPELPPPSGTLGIVPPPPKVPSFAPPGVALVGLLAVLAFVGCAAALTAAKAADQAAVLLCDAYFSAQHPGVSLHDVEQDFCTAAEDLAPFLAEAKAAEAKAGAELEAKKAAESDAGVAK